MAKVARSCRDGSNAQHPSIYVPHYFFPMRGLGNSQLRFNCLTAMVDQFRKVIARHQMVQEDIANLMGKLDGMDDPLADLLGS